MSDKSDTPRTEEHRAGIAHAWQHGGFQYMSDEEWVKEFEELELELAEKEAALLKAGFVIR